MQVEFTVSMHAYLITGGNLETRNRRTQELVDAWQTDVLDILAPEIEAEAKSIGIASVKNFIVRLNRKPLRSDSAVGIIRQAELLTTEAQNALLKTLEEPPGKSKIILSTSTEDILLPTIRSRCQNIKLATENLTLDEQFTKYFWQAWSGTPAAWLKYVDQIEKDGVDWWKEQAILTVEEELAKAGNGQSALSPKLQNQLPQLLRQLLALAPQSRLNISYKLLLDSLFINLRLPQSSLQGATL